MSNQNTSWLTFLEQQGLTLSSAEALCQPPVDTDSTTLICPLTHYQLLTVTGPDSFKFLQGQVTCNVEELRQSASRMGAHCTHKGRMIANFRAFALSEQSIGLSLYTGCLEPLKTALQKYIVFSKAQLAENSDLVPLGIAGPQAAALLQTIFPTLAVSQFATTTTNADHALCITPNIFECWLTPETAQQLWLAAAPDCKAGNTIDWDLLKIRQGIADVRAETVDMFIPQMLNLDQLGGINYKKGCYTGQEVVARMTYLGKLKRHTYRAEIKNATAPQPGTDLYSPTANQSVGNVVMAAATGNGQYECLICVTDQAVAADAVYLDQEQQQKFKTLSLPYAITDAKDDQ